MGKLIMHIPAKYQKLVRRYGIYAGRTALGIPAYEDKLVQATLARILNAIYQQDFLE